MNDFENHQLKLIGRIISFLKNEITEAEFEVLESAVRHDWTYKEIGSELGRSWKTIDSQLQSIYLKMEFHFKIEQTNRVKLVSYFRPYLSV